ncbi:hypothetical protein P8C59_004155 [Phyllachora maydis]|uniref:Ribonucleases P/MRP subunit Pop8-like domain-containing protein n=1 Tax=Phyllachora maydis TaxID=1825666 RepID=A0AAD9I1P3_9PEZI|nr:hypothetical protein P8C59_004155 [Phyllachora maydis]
MAVPEEPSDPKKSTKAGKAAPAPSSKYHDILTTTIKAPRFAYAHLSLTNDEIVGQLQQPEKPAHTGSSRSRPALDALQVRAYCTAALRRFLGDTGAGMPVDVLAIKGADGTDAWVRVPREDLAAFAAAMTAYPGQEDGEDGMLVLRLRSCGNWLGSLLGRAEESALWAGT